MRFTLVCIISVLVVGCSGGEATAPGPAEEATVLPNLAVSDGDLSRICRATVADVNGHKPSIMKVASSDAGVVRVEYQRPSDGKTWTNDCRVDGDRVILRTVDVAGQGTGPGRWRTDPMDEVIRYKLDREKVSLSTTYMDGSGGTETYSVP